MNTDNIIIIENNTSIHDVVEKINNYIKNDNKSLIAEIHSSLQSVTKALSIVEIVKRGNSELNVEIKNSNFLSNGATGSNRRAIPKVVIKMYRSKNCVRL